MAKQRPALIEIKAAQLSDEQAFHFLQNVQAALLMSLRERNLLSEQQCIHCREELRITPAPNNILLHV